MNNDSQHPSLPAVPDTKEEEAAQAFGDLRECLSAFDYVAGELLRIAPTNHAITVLDNLRKRVEQTLEKKETGGREKALEEPGAVGANTVQGPMELLGVVKAAYLKHHCGLDNVGWEQLSNMMCDALCNAMGDVEFQRWLEENTR